MSMRSWIYETTVLPTVEPGRYRGLHKFLATMKNLERQPLEVNQSLQWSLLKRMLEHASQTVPFYSRRFKEAGLSVEDIRTAADLARIPLLTRDDIRQNQSALCSNQFRHEELLEAATGGTTDSPVKIFRNRECIPLKTAMQVHFNTWAGWHPGDRVFWLWGAQSDFSTAPSWRWHIFDRYVMRRKWAATSLLSETIMARYAKAMDEFKPRGLMAYPSPLAAFSEYLTASGYKGHRPRGAVCTAEPLQEHQREVIENGLQCPIFEHYGTRDFGLAAAECEQHTGLHVNPMAIFTELLPLQGSEEGLQELVVTDLQNFGFPLIRYKINDCVHSHDVRCLCGRGFPLIGKVEGRVTDNFYLANGDLVPGVSLTNRAIKTASGIRKMQVIQETVNDFRINYIPETNFDAGSIPALTSKLREFFGTEPTFQFTQVEEIPRERSGKTRLCISKVTPPARRAGR
jgi:phenylacetate-CoA ligase